MKYINRKIKKFIDESLLKIINDNKNKVAHVYDNTVHKLLHFSIINYYKQTIGDSADLIIVDPRFIKLMNDYRKKKLSEKGKYYPRSIDDDLYRGQSFNGVDMYVIDLPNPDRIYIMKLDCIMMNPTSSVLLREENFLIGELKLDE